LDQDVLVREEYELEIIDVFFNLIFDFCKSIFIFIDSCVKLGLLFESMGSQVCVEVLSTFTNEFDVVDGLLFHFTVDEVDLFFELSS